MRYIRRKVRWRKQDVNTYGGDGEYAGSYTNPDFVNIQRADPSDCVVAKHEATGYWYWFAEDDTLLPWSRLGDDTSACECGVHFLDSRRHGPFATERGAKHVLLAFR